MGTRVTLLQRLPTALSSALLEWILILLLFIDAVYCFLLTRFARLCKLPVPCPFCSRLDHVLGNEKPCFYRELICKTHKSEISSLAFCDLHQKLVYAETMCESCSTTLHTAKEEPNNDDDANEPMLDQINDAMSHSSLSRICSCCAQLFRQGSVPLFSRKIAEPKQAEVAASPKICTNYSVSDRVDETLEMKDIYHQSDHIFHERYSPLQMTSDSEVDAPCADDGRNSHPYETDIMEKDFQEDGIVERSVIPSPEAVIPSEMNVQKELGVTDSCDISSVYPIVNGHPDSTISGGYMEAKDVSSGTRTSQNDSQVAVTESCLEDVDDPQIQVASISGLPHISREIEVCRTTSESNIDTYTSQFTILEQHYAVSGDKHVKDNLEQVHGSEVIVISSDEFHGRNASTHDRTSITEPASQGSHCVASEANFGNIHASHVSVHSEAVVEVQDNPRKDEPVSDKGTHELTSEDPSKKASEDMITKDFAEEAHISSVAVGSSGEVSQSVGVTEEHPKASETIGERRPSLSNQISMNEAYNIAIGMKSSLPSPFLTDVILGKDTSSAINEELRLLLSQLSASRGLEAPWVDPGPSPRQYGRGDDLVVNNITKRISMERNASGFESLDGSIVSEIEGESTIDRMRRQIDLDRKSIHLLCKELEEERNAAAIAASQTLAMITRLQNEKAAMQMEASHYQRMMEEQEEYISEALAEANELLAQREQQVEKLEAELQNYRMRFKGAGPTEKQASQDSSEEQNIAAALLEEERAYIANCLRKLEEKLHFYSNNSTSTYLSNSDTINDDLFNKLSAIDDDSQRRQERSKETKESILLAKEFQSSTMNTEADLTTFQEEISNLNRRLKTLEGDRDFLEHTINSLSYGGEGVMFIREIARNLRDLRAIATDNK